MFGAFLEKRLVQDPGWQVWGAGGDAPAGTNTEAGVSVTNDSTLKLLAVYGSISFISDLLGQLPTDHYREDQDGKQPAMPKAGFLDRPNPELTGQDYITQFMSSLLWEGNSYSVVMRDSRGDVAEVWPLNPYRVTPYRNVAAPIRYEIDGAPFAGEILHVRAFTLPGSIVGCNPITYARESIGSGLAQQTAGSSFYKNGSNPNMVIETPQGPETVDAGKLKEGIDKYHKGSEKSHGTLVLTGGATAKTLTISPADAQFLEGRNFTAAEITTGLYRIPPENLGYVMQGSSSLTYQNLEQRWTELRRRCFGTWITKYERAMSSLLPDFEYVKLNDSAYMRADEKTRYEADKTAIDGGFLTPNEAREKEDLAPLPDQLQVNQSDAETIGVLIRAGYEPDSVIAAVTTGDLQLLKHTGQLPVTVQTDSTSPTAPAPDQGEQ